jgi:hypothetical protein
MHLQTSLIFQSIVYQYNVIVFRDNNNSDNNSINSSTKVHLITQINPHIRLNDIIDKYFN